MGQAFFITGFNNWGKSTIIRSLFSFNNFRFRRPYNLRPPLDQIDFTVDSHSNDDYWGNSWIDQIQRRIELSPDNGENLFTALCPTLEENNSFVTLLSHQLFSRYERLNLFLIEYKWEHNAKLMIENIIEQGRNIPNINFIRINSDKNMGIDIRLNAKVQQIQDEMQNIFNN